MSGEADVTGAQDHASLIVQGKDRPGIVAAVTAVLAGFGANIVSLDQYSDDPQGGAFFQRTVCGLEHLPAVLPEVEKKLAETLAAGFELEFRLRDLSVPQRVALFDSRADHCLLDLPWRDRRGEMPISEGMVLSHPPH